MSTLIQKTFFFLLIGFVVSPACSTFRDPGASRQRKQDRSEPPNIIILFADDMGYGDLSSYGSPTINTPNIDRLASQGTRFTSFYTGSWCVPSRIQLLTGRYMPRMNLGGSTGADGFGRLPNEEVTLAEGLKSAGYRTGMAGKWHLGYKRKSYLPPNRGFDSWFGLPYSNDYRKPWVQTEEPLGLYRGTEMVDHPIDQNTLTTRYTKEALHFIRENGSDEAPFFFYLAYNMPHLPLHTTDRFRGTSGAGLYGDVIRTIDWSVGRVLETLREEGLRENTIVFFASDNGPWLDLPDRMLQEGNKPWHAGSPGPFRGHKHTTYEGGPRVPAMIRWPGHIKRRVTDELAASPDIYRTFLEVAGAGLPDHTLDGYNLMPFLNGRSDSSPREQYIYFQDGVLEAVRKGKWKLRYKDGKAQLFNLKSDPGERFNRASDRPEKVEELGNIMEQYVIELDVDFERSE